MKNISIVILFIFILGCGMSSIPGQTLKTKSEFDNAEEIRMLPAWIDAKGAFGSGIKLGFYRTSRMEPDKVIMIAEIQSSGKIINPVFSPGQSLKFKVDDKIYSFESNGVSIKEHAYNEYAGGIYTLDSQEYSITKDFLKTLMNGKRIVVKIDLIGSSYKEGVFADGGYTTIRPGLANFFKQAFNK